MEESAFVMFSFSFNLSLICTKKRLFPRFRLKGEMTWTNSTLSIDGGFTHSRIYCCRHPALEGSQSLWDTKSMSSYVWDTDCIFCGRETHSKVDQRLWCCLRVCIVVSLWVRCLGQEIPSGRSGAVGTGSAVMLVVFRGLCIRGSIVVCICVDVGICCSSLPTFPLFLFPSFFVCAVWFPFQYKNMWNYLNLNFKGIDFHSC